MSFLKNFDWSAKSIFKVIGLILAGVIVLTIVVALISFSIRTIFNTGYNESQMYGKGAGGFMAEDAAFAPTASRSISPQPGYSTGSDAEEFEIKTYSAYVETRKLDETCGKVSALKSRSDVIFENANQSDENCYFSFKVEKEVTSEILQIIESLDPKDLNENIQTIKGRVENIDQQLQILQNKLDSIESTLISAQEQYDELTELATRQQDVESLTKIIDSKLNLIEKLTSQRIDVKEQIDRYQQNKQDQLDRLNYSFFNVNIQEDLIWDWENIKDSWKREVQLLVDNFNDAIQSVSVGLVTFLIRIAQAAVYFFIAIFLLKYAWVATKRIWKGKKK